MSCRFHWKCCLALCKIRSNCEVRADRLPKRQGTLVDSTVQCELRDPDDFKDMRKRVEFFVGAHQLSSMFVFDTALPQTGLWRMMEHYLLDLLRNAIPFVVESASALILAQVDNVEREQCGSWIALVVALQNQMARHQRPSSTEPQQKVQDLRSWLCRCERPSKGQL